MAVQTGITRFTLAQLAAIIRAESRIQWRFGTWKLIAFGYLALVLFVTLTMNSIPRSLMFDPRMVVDHYLIRSEWDEPSQQWVQVQTGVLRVSDYLTAADTQFTPEKTAAIQNTVIGLNVVRVSTVFIVVGLLLMTADSIPLDRKLGTRETLNSLPLTLPVYLGGKVFSVWWNALKISILAIVVTCGLMRVVYGNFDLWVIAVAWAFLALPIILGIGTTAVCLPSFAPTRRIALFIGLISVPFVLLLFAVSITEFANLVFLIDPIYRFTLAGVDVAKPNTEIITEALGVIALYGALTISSFTFAYLIQRWQQR